MKYSKFLIQNYKGIKHLELDLSKTPDAKVFTFVGLNESGKTTILDAIDFLETDQPSGKEHTLIPKNKKGIFKEEVSVEATLVLDEQDVSEIKTYLDKKNYTANTIPDHLVIKKAYTFQGSIFQSKVDTLTFKIYGKPKGSRAKSDSLLADSDPVYLELIKKLKNTLIPPIIYYPNFLFDFPSKIYLEAYTGESNRQETLP
jgi:AAA15 family ATPase/GTPase